MGDDAINLAALELAFLGGRDMNWRAEGIGFELGTKLAVYGEQGVGTGGLGCKNGMTDTELQ